MYYLRVKQLPHGQRGDCVTFLLSHFCFLRRGACGILLCNDTRKKGLQDGPPVAGARPPSFDVCARLSPFFQLNNGQASSLQNEAKVLAKQASSLSIRCHVKVGPQQCNDACSKAGSTAWRARLCWQHGARGHHDKSVVPRCHPEPHVHKIGPAPNHCATCMPPHAQDATLELLLHVAQVLQRHSTHINR